MVDVAPVKGWEYDATRVPTEKAVAPPHDTLTVKEIAHFRGVDAHNIVHATLPAKKKGSRTPDFAAAGALVEKWLETGILRERPEPCVYAYECRYAYRGQPRRVRGTLMLLRLDPTHRHVVPHEDVFPQFVENRRKVLEAVSMDLEPIELLYGGESAEKTLWGYVDGSKSRPTFNVRGHDGSEHRVWRIVDEPVINALKEQFRNRRVYIADGHHRYAAALAHAAAKRAADPRASKDAPWEFKLAWFVNASDAGLGILPTHRIVRKASTHDPVALAASWQRHFRVDRAALSGPSPVAALMTRVEAASHPAVGVWLGEAGMGYVLEAKHSIAPLESMPGRSASYRSLDAAHLQWLALTEAFGVPEDRWGEDVAYTRDDAEAEAAVTAKEAFAVLVHRPTRLQQLMSMADAGERMPQKSTYFVPKILSGLVLHRLALPAAPPSVPRRRYTS